MISLVLHVIGGFAMGWGFADLVRFLTRKRKTQNIGTRNMPSYEVHPCEGTPLMNLEIDIGPLTHADLEIAFDGVINALAVLDAQGYKAGDIVDGLSRAAAIVQACQVEARREK